MRRVKVSNVVIATFDGDEGDDEARRQNNNKTFKSKLKRTH